MATCVVSFLDSDGIRHSVEVQADSLYEAAAKAIRVFRDKGHNPGDASNLEVEIRTSILHTLTAKKLAMWMEKGPNAPRDVAMKQKIRKILSG